MKKLEITPQEQKLLKELLLQYFQKVGIMQATEFTRLEFNKVKNLINKVG